MLSSGWLGRGEVAKKFEAKLCTYQKFEHNQLHTVASCSDAIFGSLRLFSFKPGTEVILPSNSFPAVGNSILECGLIPRLVDIDSKTGNASVQAILDACSADTAAIFITHYGGIPFDTNLLRTNVSQNVKILEDCAAALGTFKHGVAIGQSADFACWSFDAMKLLCCGEGGALYSRDEDLVKRAKEYFYLGLPQQQKSGIDRVNKSDHWWEYDIRTAGRRSLFTDVNAAIGLTQIDDLSNRLEKKQAIAERYQEVLDHIGMSYVRSPPHDGTYSNYFFTVQTKQRDRLARHFRDNGVYTTLRYSPLNRTSLYEKYSPIEMPGTKKFFSESLNIPIHHNLTEDSVTKIINLLEDFKI